MKKLMILILALGLVIPTTWAQTTKGSFAVGGGISFNSGSNNNEIQYQSNSFQISPQASYFVSDNLEVGLEFGLSSSRYGFEGDDPTKNNSLSVGPFARYYKFTSNERFAFTAQAGFSIGSGKTTQPNGNEQKSGSVGIYVSPGFTYFLSEKWGLDFQLQGISYGSSDPNKDVDNNEQTSFTFGISSLNPSLGFRYFISK